MTLANPTNVATFIGNGVTTVFPYTFRIPGATPTDQSNVEVTLLEIATGIESAPLSNSVWSITGVDTDTYGNVTYPLVGSALAATYKLNIRRVVPYEQELDLTIQSAYFPELLEDQLDLIVMQIQQLAEEGARSVKVSLGLSTDPEDFANDLLIASAAATAAAAAAVSVASGIIKVRVATVAAITISTALNNGDTIDGVVLATGDIVLVKDQAAPAENGYYTVGVVPVRATGFTVYNTIAGSLCLVNEGTVNLDTQWICSSNAGGTIDVTALTFIAQTVAKTSTTEVLTGTDTTKAVTADALAALWEKGTDVASAATVTLGEGGFFHITGGVTTTDIDWTTAKNGRSAWLEFDGILTLTHNGTTLVLPGGVNITTAAGDRAFVLQDNADNVHVMTYVRAAQRVDNGMEFVTSIAAAASSTINFDSSTGVTFDANYDYIVSLTSVKPSVDASIYMRYGTGGTPTYQATSYNNQTFLSASTTNTGARDSIITVIQLTPVATGGASANEDFSLEVKVDEPAANAHHTARCVYGVPDVSGTLLSGHTSGKRTTAEVLTGLQILPSAGNFTSGTFTLYRRKIR